VAAKRAPLGQGLRRPVGRASKTWGVILDELGPSRRHASRRSRHGTGLEMGDFGQIEGGIISWLLRGEGPGHLKTNR